MTVGRQVVEVPGVIYSPLEDRARIAGTGVEPWMVMMTFETARCDWQSVRESFDWLTEEQLRAALDFARANPEMTRTRIEREHHVSSEIESLWREHPRTRPEKLWRAHPEWRPQGL
jgi:uncharacterized protein (DUF433 family)